MKKHILAVSVAAAFGVMAGSAVAAPVIKSNGIGNVNLIPYFSTQGSNVTQISITNTDSLYGKAVKVRFRGAEWSDDIFDFTVFLSPGDVFTGQVGVDATGVSNFTTSDGSCTLPESVNQSFPVARLSDQTKVASTREGYVEIINMADIVNTGATGTNYDLFRAIKHVNGVAPCKTSGSTAANVVTGLKQDNWVTAAVAPQSTWMKNPTGTLTSWNRVIDVTNVKAFGVPTTAIDYTTGTDKAYFEQTYDSLTPSSLLTTDQIFYNVSSVANTPVWTTTAPITQMYQFDMPDLSTPIETTTLNAVDARDLMATALAKSAVMAEFSTLSSVNGATDVVLTQPVRRYFYTYQNSTGTVEGTSFSRNVNSSKYNVTGWTGTVYQPLTIGNTIPLMNLANAANGPYVPTGASASPVLIYDREEQFDATSSGIVISPTPPGTAISLSLKGEASVIAVNRSATIPTGALGASLTINGVTSATFNTGWFTFSTISNGTNGGKLPIIGYTALNVAGANQYGVTLPLRYFGANAGTVQH